MGIKKRGLFFFIDALVFSTILLGALLLFPPQTPQHPIQNPNFFIAQDILGVLSELTISELNNTWVQQQATSGAITDINQSVLSQIGIFWSANNLSMVDSLVNQTLRSTLPPHVHYGLFFDGEVLFQSTEPSQSYEVNSWRVVSGLQKAKPVRGFVANARAVHIRGNNTMTVSISPEGAGWHRGRVEITKYFNTSGRNISAAELIVSTHASTQHGLPFSININNICTYDRTDIDWMFGADDGDVGNAIVTHCLVDGMNKINMTLANYGYNAHTHPGMLLAINYTAEADPQAQDVHVSQRFYFDNIRSIEANNDGAGVWSMLPFYIPEDAANLSVALQIAAKNVRNYNYPAVPGCDIRYVNLPSDRTECNFFSSWDGSSRRARDYDYLLFINGNTPFDFQGAPAANPIYRYNTSQLSGRLVNGTNLVAVYFNNYGDYVWGNSWVELSSNPADPSSSYIELNYTRANPVPYGLVEIVQRKTFVGRHNEDMTINFTYPVQAVRKGETFLHIIQQYSYQITSWANSFKPPTSQLFRSPSARAIPTTTYIDPQRLALSSLTPNFIRARDDNSGNDILNISSIEYHFYVPSYVGYGDVFSTEEEATADALARLQAAAGTYIDYGSINTSINSITRVPSLWGPIVAEVRVWGLINRLSFLP